MKILHTADWHLGKKLDHFYRFQEQKEVLEEIIKVADNEKVNAVLIAGDIFDAFNPPTEAIELFYKTIKRLANNGTRPVILIAGNHDSPDRIDLPSPLAMECGIISIGYPHARLQPFKLDTGLEITQSDHGFFELKIPGVTRLLRIIHTAYANEYRLKEFLGTENKDIELQKVLENGWKKLASTYCNREGINIFMAHLFFIKKGEMLPVEPDDEKPILHVGGVPALYSYHVPGEIHYAALGHLHRPHIVDTHPCPVVYAGSPLSYSFSEANQEKTVNILSFDNAMELTTRQIVLKAGKKLYRKKFESIRTALEWLKENPDTLVEITLVTESFLTAEDRRLLNDMHKGIITIIPELKGSVNEADEDGLAILDQNINELFAQYFAYKHGQPPNDEIKNLFKEILAQERN